MSILTEKKTWERESSRRGRQRKTGLTPEQQANVKRAIEHLRVQIGSPARFAEALGLSVAAMWKATGPRRKPTARLAIAVARAAAVMVDDVIGGTWPKVCPYCGKV